MIGEDEASCNEAEEIANTLICGNLTHAVERLLDPDRSREELAILSMDLVNMLVNIRIQPTWQVVDHMTTLIRRHTEEST
jgi:hypothetical protein